MAEQKPVSSLQLAKMLRETNAEVKSITKALTDTNARVDALAQVVAQERQSPPVIDESAIVEKIQAQLARQFLPSIENLQNSLKEIGGAVMAMQQGLDSKIVARVETIFKANKDALLADMSAIAQARQQAQVQENDSPEPPSAGQTNIASLIPKGVVREAIDGLAANAQAIATLINAVRGQQPGQQIVQTIDLVMKGVTIGEKIGRGGTVSPQELSQMFIPPKS